MTTRHITPVIQLLGPPGSGKTTLCRLFLDAFSGKSVLAVDASPDGFLALSYALSGVISVSDMVQKLSVAPLSKEAMDWALQDLPCEVPSESESDILLLGKLPENLTQEMKSLLLYGLPRLFEAYDVVVWEDCLENAPTWTKPEALYPLVVITAQDEEFCKNLKLDHAMVLLSKALPTDGLPPSAQAQVLSGNWQFLGKLPPLIPAEKRVKELPEYFRECFHKLDLPISL